MARTFLQLKNFVKRALENSATESDVTHTIIVNDAGTHLFSTRAWNFRLRPPVLLDLIKDQPYIELPRDYAEPTAYRLNGLTQDINFTTPQQLATFRDRSLLPAGFRYYMALVHPPQVIAEIKPPPPRYEIYPTPTADDVDVLALWYRGQWIPLANDTEIANTPDYVDPLLMLLMQAFAWGYLDKAFWGDLDEILERIENGRVFKAAKRIDMMAQPEVGPITGGAVESLSRSPIHYTESRPLPSIVN